MKIRLSMSLFGLRIVTFALGAALIVAPSVSFSQGSDPKAGQSAANPADAQRNGPPQRRLDDINEVLKALGSPLLREALLVEVEKHPNLRAHPGPQTIYLQWRIA